MKKINYARLSITMAIAYQLLLITLIFLRPDIHPYSNTISEWAIGKFGWLMQIAFFCSAFSYLLLFLTIKNEIKGLGGKMGLILLFICFVGTVGVGVFVTNPYPPDFADLLINLNISRRNSDWVIARNILKLTAFLPLIAFIGFIVHLNIFVIPLGANAVGENVPIGYPPRIMFLCYHIWLAILAFQYIKINNHDK